MSKIWCNEPHLRFTDYSKDDRHDYWSVSGFKDLAEMHEYQADMLAQWPYGPKVVLDEPNLSLSVSMWNNCD